jgi:hypothetical protein
MPDNRRFFVVSLAKAIDSDASMTKAFNDAFNRTVPPSANVHMVSAVAIDGRIVCFFREYDERERGAKR